jgi:hypothetical protein
MRIIFRPETTTILCINIAMEALSWMQSKNKESFQKRKLLAFLDSCLKLSRCSIDSISCIGTLNPRPYFSATLKLN